MLFASFDLPTQAPSAGISWPDISLAFFALLLEGAPFLLLGATISGLIDVLLPADQLKSWLPRSKSRGILVAIAAGIAFPLCECGAMPIVQRLVRKGIPPAVAITYMLAAPALNPLALVGTYLAFRNQDPWLMVVLRFTLSLAVLGYLATWLVQLKPEFMVRPELIFAPKRAPDLSPNPGLVLTPRPGRSRGGLQQFCGAVVRDFTGVLPFLVIGAGAAAFFSTGINTNLLTPLGHHPIGGPLAGIALAEALCLCSTTDAFIIAAFTPFSLAAKLAFLVAGPLIDLKLYWMYRSAFPARFVHGLWIRALGATLLLTIFLSLRAMI